MFQSVAFFLPFVFFIDQHESQSRYAVNEQLTIRVRKNCSRQKQCIVSYFI